MSSVLQSFLDSWPLFRETYLAAWLIALLLSMAGVFVVARDQIFVGAAIAQASTLGIALALCVGAAFAAEGSFWRTELSHTLVGGAFAIGAALVVARVGASGGAGAPGGTGRESHEAVTGFIFLLGASASVLLLARSPHGLEEVQNLVSSSVIGATMADVVLFAGLAAVTLLFVLARRRPLVLLAMDPLMARAAGFGRGLNVLCSAWLGLVMGMTIHAAGVIYAFGCLVLPALIAKNVCRETLSMFVVAPVVAVGAALAGFVAGNGLDFNEAQFTVALLCVLLALAWGARALRRP